MATYLTRNGRVTALIRHTLPDGKKQSHSKTFATEEEAKIWGENFVPISRAISRHDQYLLSLRDTYRLQRHPADKATCGIYFLYAKNTCIYIGQSKNIHVRIRDHQNPGSERRGFDRFAFIEVPPDSLDAAEAYYIVLMNPTLNIAMNAGFKSSRPE